MNDDVSFTPSLLQRFARGLVLVVVPIAVVASLVSSVLAPDAPHVDLAGAAFLVVFLGLLVVIPSFIAWRSMTLRVTITRAEVVVRNMLSTRHVPLDEVAGFEPFEFGTQNVFARLRLTPGPRRIPRTIVVWAIAQHRRSYALTPQSFAARRAKVQPVVDAMNAELDRRRGGPRASERLVTVKPGLRSIPWDDD